MEYSKCICFYVLLLVIKLVSSSEESTTPEYKLLKRVYNQCEQSDNMFKCLKIQALKFADRAMNTESINLIDGISFVRTAEGRSFSSSYVPLNEDRLEELKSNEIDGLLVDRAQRFLDNHKIEVSMSRIMEEGRKKKDKGMGGYLAVMAMMKGGLIAMGMKGIALIAGKALLVGKIALTLSIILGLKKLLSSEGHEKTTYEIVKHPHVSHSNSYSSSHYGGDEYEGGGGGGGGGGGHYHRSLSGGDMMMQDRAYRAYVPKNQ